nr:hypothetical protein [Tanacetum cinerariifolium]
MSIMLSRISFHVLYDRLFKTSCLLNYALMIHHDYDITSSLRRGTLQLWYQSQGRYNGGIDDLPIAEIYSGMDNLRYVTEGKLTFFKNKFSPQWRFLVHTILHCLSTKSVSWDQFGSPIVVALICLSDGRRFNWSSYIFKGMVSNIGNAKKFLMYPRFLQAILGIETRIKRQYKVLIFSNKLFANMRLHFEGYPMPLLPAMLLQAQAGEGAGVAAQAVPQHMPAPDQPQDHFSDPNTASFSRSQETDAGPFTNVEDEPLEGSFHMSPPRSTQAPHAGQPSGGAKDPITLTALSSVVSTLVQKGPHMNYQCQPMNQDSYNSNSLGFDQPQPPQSPIIHQPPQELSIPEMEDLKQQYLDELQRLSNLEYRDEIKIAELRENFNGMRIEIRKKEKLLQDEQWAYLSTHPSKRLHSFCFDDDDEDYTFAITPDEHVLSTEEPDNSLSMGASILTPFRQPNQTNS